MYQVYKAVDARYVFQDKYFGRKVTISDFPSVLASFLSNGACVLSYHIPLILRQLYRLAGIVHCLDRYRFYAASLLFIYDGDADVQEKYETSLQEGVTRAGGGLGEETDANDPDRTEGLSLETATTTATGRRQHLRSTRNPPPSNPSAHRVPSDTSSPSDSSKRKAVPGAVIIRLIDFAHCTTGDDFVPPNEDYSPRQLDLSDTRIMATFPPTHPNQPDLGFLLGLKSLCAALKMIWAEEEESAHYSKKRDHRGGGGKGNSDLAIEGEDVFEKIFGEGALDQGLGEIPPDSVWNSNDLATA